MQDECTDPIDCIRVYSLRSVASFISEAVAVEGYSDYKKD